MTDLIQSKVAELNRGLYGPRHCSHCNKTVRVRVFKLAGSDFFESNASDFRNDKLTVAAGFIGSYACDECLRPIEQDHVSQAQSQSEEK